MGLRFHKSIKLGKLLKLNINKKSVSVSVGVKGAHITLNNKGKKTASVGLPGTGLSYQKTLDSGKKKSSKTTKSKKDDSILDNIMEDLEDAARDIKDDLFGNNNDDNDNEEKNI